MDVNLSENPIREDPSGASYGAGAGGWPTIKYFNQETGLKSGTYVKKTQGHMCDELGDEEMMNAYIEEYGKTSLCSTETGKGCSDRAVKYIEKMKVKSSEDLNTELTRLTKMDGKSMKVELKDWVDQRKKILKQMVASSSEL